MDSVKFFYTDNDLKEQGILKNASIDAEVGKYDTSSNDFELQIAINSWDRTFNTGSIFYLIETEFGGYVDSKKVDTSKKSITLKGKTFRGLLEKEYVQPATAEAYYVAQGEANTIINDLIKGRFDSLYVVDNIGLSDITVNYQMRDINLLEAIEKMLYNAEIKSRLDVSFHDGQVHLQALPIIDLSELLQYDQSYGITMIAETPSNKYNHILALGKGELTERLRVNLYLQDDNTWTKQENTSYSNFNRITYKYDNSNEEDESKLIEGAIEATEKANGTSNLQVTFTSDNADLFDIVGAKEEITQLSFKEQITKKILKATIKGIAANCKYEYKVGDK